MRRILCLALAILTAVSVMTAISSSAADNGKLVIIDEGRELAEVDVGCEFIYNVGVCAGDYLINQGQGYINYNSYYAEIVEYGPLRSNGTVYLDGYCFPEKIRNASLVTNYKDNNRINYNFVRYSGVDTFNDLDKHYFKIRFKAVRPGRVEIGHVMDALGTRIDNKTVRLFTFGEPNTQFDPVPFTVSTAEPAIGYIGDADGDWDLSVLDATFIQYLAAGRDSEYSMLNADVNGDGTVDLLDALEILRYKAEMTTGSSVGEWIFESEQNIE